MEPSWNSCTTSLGTELSEHSYRNAHVGHAFPTFIVRPDLEETGLLLFLAKDSGMISRFDTKGFPEKGALPAFMLSNVTFGSDVVQKTALSRLNDSQRLVS